MNKFKLLLHSTRRFVILHCIIELLFSVACSSVSKKRKRNINKGSSWLF